MNDPVGEVLAALADGTRRSIVRQLADGAMPTATELARDMPISRQAISKHLRVLEDAHLVDIQRRGREARYRLRPEPLGLAEAWLSEVGTTWDHRLARLKTLSETTADDPSG